MATSVQKITPFLWFDTQAEEAVQFYVSIFPDSEIKMVSHYGEGAPMPKGSVMTVAFELAGQEFTALNGGPHFKFSEAISFVVHCQTQQEIDHYWSSLAGNGGKEVQCGWLKDKYGLSWQIVPDVMLERLRSGDGQKTARMMKAMYQMVKLDIAKLEAAYNGE